MYLSGGFAGICIVGVLGKSCKDDAAKKDLISLHTKQWEAKMGYVIAEHGATQQEIIKCWVVPPRFGNDSNFRVGVRGPDFWFGSSNYSWIEVPDRNDAEGFARTIGVSDLSKCIRSGPAPQ